VSLVIQFGLENYLKKVLGQGSRQLKSKKGRPLLDYALDPMPYAQYSFITPKIVELLLDHGANPNKTFEKKSSWEKALRWQYDNYAIQKGWRIGTLTERVELARIRLEIFKLLVERNAAPSLLIKVSDRKEMIGVREAVTQSFELINSEALFQSFMQNLALAEDEQAKLSHKIRQLWF
jgi:hypothetical protein